MVRLISRLIDAAPNVVRLPTAAPRQVKQIQNRNALQARAQFRAAQPWPGKHIHPGRRAAMALAKQIAEIEHTPALLLVSAMFQLLNRDDRIKVAEAIAGGAVAGKKVNMQALAITRAATMNFGEQLDYFNACDRLKRGELE